MDTTFFEGLKITVIGMGLVFAALILLWGIMVLMGRLSAWQMGRSASKEPASDARAPARVAPGGELPTTEEMAAIAAAFAILRTEQEIEESIPWRLPPTLTRWAAVGFGRKLHSWQPGHPKREP
ncbi:MAG: OadG family protein [Chloroflexota bacterium]|nr:OadG family protein [Chloroflexota bacterium]